MSVSQLSASQQLLASIFARWYNKPSFTTNPPLREQNTAMQATATLTVMTHQAGACQQAECDDQAESSHFHYRQRLEDSPASAELPARTTIHCETCDVGCT